MKPLSLTVVAGHSHRRVRYERGNQVVKTMAAAGLMLLAASPALADAEARPRSAPAKGTKDCVIAQITSTGHEQIVAAAGGRYTGDAVSSLRFSVQKTGGVNVSFTDDQSPGSKLYFMINGKRYSGDAGYQLPLDSKALAGLKADKLIQFTYTTWPHRNEVSRSDVFIHFAKAYDCRAFLAKPGF